MNRKRVIISTIVLMLCLFLGAFPSIIITDSQTAPADPIVLQESETEGIIHSGPADIKEKVGVIFFLGWVWLSIFVLIYFLRLKVKETDRLLESGFYSNGKGKTCQED